MIFNINSYSGSHELVTVDQEDAIRFLPNAGGNSRHVSLERFIPPIRVAGWIKPSYWTASDSPYDGIHVHVGHVGNDRNYVASLVRRDGNQKIAVEYGWREYRTLDTAPSTGPALKWNRVYLLQVDWYPDRIISWVGNEVETSIMEAPIPDDRIIPYGSVGLRLDNIEAVGAFSVRPL